MRAKKNEKYTIEKTLRITGTGTIAANVLQVFGTVRIVDQHASITKITTLVNATGMYAVLASAGETDEDLTADGAVLSGLPVGSSFLKDKDITESYSVLDATTQVVSELLQDNKAGKPFTIQQKNGADTFVKLYLTTTDNPIDFTIHIVFEYERLSPGSKLVFL